MKNLDPYRFSAAPVSVLTMLLESGVSTSLISDSDAAWSTPPPKLPGGDITALAAREREGRRLKARIKRDFIHSFFLQISWKSALWLGQK